MCRAQRHPLLKEGSDKRDGHCIAHGPPEFLEVHGVHVHAFLLAWDGYVFCVFPDADKGACLDIVISSVLNEVFDGLTGFGAFLHFIEDNDRFASFQDDIVYGLQLQENEIQVH